MTITVTNNSGCKITAWVSSHDMFPGSQTDWYPIEVGDTESWDRSAANKVTIKHGAKEVVIQSSGNDDYVVKEEGVYNGTDVVAAFIAAEAKQ